MYHVNNRETLLPKFIVVFSVVIWFLTETLSVFHALTSNNIRLIWTVIGIVCLGSLVGILKRFDINVRAILRWIRKYILEIARGQWLELILISAFFVLAAGMFYLAYTIVPNNWDSMTYHLARVANWIQNTSVEYYPTNIPRQLYYSSFTEYFILHICLLFRNDQFVNIVQWCGYIFTTAMIYKIMHK